MLLAVGIVSILGQVALLRELLVAFFGSELIYLLSLSFLLVATAVGTLVGALHSSSSPHRIGLPFLVFAICLPALAVLCRGLRILLRGTPGAFLPFTQQLLGMALVLVPFGLLCGFLFRRAAGAWVAGSGTLATAYAIESAGGLVGGFLATALVGVGVQNLAALLACAALAAGAARLSMSGRGRLLASGAFLLLALAVAFSSPLDRTLTRWTHPDLAATRDTPYGRVTVTRRSGQVVVFANDALAYESQGTTAEELVHLAALEHPDPRAILLLGGAVEGLVGEALKHRPAELEVVEVDARMIATVLPFLPDTTRGALEDPSVRLTFEDPRRFLEAPGRWDVVVIGAPEPDSGQANRFYTQELFAACAARMSSDGVLALRLRGSENLWSPALLRRNASIVRALETVFPSVLTLAGTSHLFLASLSPLSEDPFVLVQRLEERGIKARLVVAPYLRYLLTNDRRAELAARLRETSAPPNRDRRPICYQYTLILWLARFFPGIALLAPPALETARGGIAATVAILVLALLASRRSAGVRRALLVATAGFVGMVLEGALLLAYQARYGVLYQDLGILLTVFMAGLAFGSMAVARRFAPPPPRGSGALLVLGATAVCLLTAGFLEAGFPGGLAGTSLLLAASGAIVGAFFAWASLAQVDDPAAVIGPLYAADLLGGSVGSLVGTLFLLPVLGLPASAFLLAGLTLALLILV